MTTVPAWAVPAAPIPGRRAVVRRPSPDLGEGLITHVERQPVDPELALEQWRAYCDALAIAGWQIIEAPPADQFPDGVFIEDTALAYGDLLILTRPGAAERAGETEGLAEIFGSLGQQVVDLGAGHLDGGDVLKYDATVLVGVGGRTTREGMTALTRHLEPLGARVRPIAMERALHLKSAVTALPDGTIIGWDQVAPSPAHFDHYVPALEEGGAHVVLLGEDRILMAASAPRTTAMLRDRGWRVLTVDISEFEKMEGCVTCLSVRLRGAQI